MSKKSDGAGGSTTLITTMATTGGLLLLRKGLAAAWKKVTGRVPPTDLTDPKVTLPEALAWGVATGIIVETARFFIVRSTMRRPARTRARNLARKPGWTGRSGPAGGPPAGTGRQAAHSRQISWPFLLLGKLAPVVHKEAARAGELVRLPRYHPK